MSVQAIEMQERMESVQSSAVDGLIANYFDQAFLMFNVFVDDPRTCLDLSERVFRLVGVRGDTSEQGFYAQLAALVRELPATNEVHPAVSVDCVLCWLLKDSANLSYDEIAAAMEMERGAVQTAIADVRMALLG